MVWRGSRLESPLRYFDLDNVPDRWAHARLAIPPHWEAWPLRADRGQVLVCHWLCEAIPHIGSMPAQRHPRWAGAQATSCHFDSPKWICPQSQTWLTFLVLRVKPCISLDPLSGPRLVKAYVYNIELLWGTAVARSCRLKTPAQCRAGIAPASSAPAGKQQPFCRPRAGTNVFIL